MLVWISRSLIGQRGVSVELLKREFCHQNLSRITSGFLQFNVDYGWMSMQAPPGPHSVKVLTAFWSFCIVLGHEG